jgi:hypothetical protein
MSTQTDFTPSRTEEFTHMLDMLGITDSMERRRRETYERHYHLRRARERDQDSRAPLILWCRGDSSPDLERYGRRFVWQIALDGLAERVGARRGGALTARPDEELRHKIALFKRIQGMREAAFEFTGRGEYGGKDVPARLGLGGMQDFTPRP